IGQVQAQYSETYTFYATSDDGERLYVDGKLLVDAFYDHGPTEFSGSITLLAGHQYDIRMEYYANGYGGSVATLAWSSPSTPKQIIPAGALSHPTTGGFYDRLLVQNTTTNRVVLDQFVYVDPAADGTI